MREIFKTKDVKNIKETLRNLDMDPKLVLQWINENLPREYVNIEDLSNAYDMLSKADMFLGRTFRNQNFKLWSYACDIMYGGVATAKSRNYPNNRYFFPIYLKDRKKSKSIFESKNTIIEKLSVHSHTSNVKTRDNLMLYFTMMFKNNLDFAIKMKKVLKLTENEVKYLLGKSHIHKFDEIFNLTKNEKIVAITKENNKENNEDKNEKRQQSLLDF